MRALFAAGGTGGHLFPALEIADELSEQGVSCGFSAHGLSTSKMFPQDRYPFWDIPAAPPSKIGSFLWTTLISTVRAFRLLGRFRPDYVIGFGSFHTFPILVATWLRRVPLYLFEPNVAPGRVIRLFAPYARRIGVCFPEAVKALGSKAVVVAMPLLRSHTGHVNREEAFRRYGIQPDRPVVLAFGGSQGSQVINETVLEAISSKMQLVLLCGLGQDREALLKKAEKLGVKAHILLFEREMAFAYAVADVVVCRSGASTVAELKSFQKPAVCIPYPFAKDNHQLMNAQSLHESGLAEVIKEEDLTSKKLHEAIVVALGKDVHVASHESGTKFSDILPK